uniref:Uncharacterized protein n=1 Tax=Panstrongylus lignarius TaxID=156445 RepID=A0A224XVI4_9HEMI
MPPVAMAISCRVAFLLSPNPGAFTAATCRPIFSLFTTSVERASPSISSAIITSGFLLEFAYSRAGMIDCTDDIFFSESNSRQSWNSTLAPLVVLMKYGEIYPLSNFMPSITSSSSFNVLPSLTVITPSFPTFFIASEIRSPIFLSPLAEIVAT